MHRRIAVFVLFGFAFPLVAQDKDSDAAKNGAKPEKKPRPAIYDEKADGKELVKAALAKAAKENRRVLIQWGANWCGWCHILHDVCKKDREIARLIQYEYDVVLLDIGKMDKNEDLVKKYDVDLKGHGVPYFTILDGEGKLVVNSATDGFETPKEKSKTNGYETPKVVEFLKKNAAKPLVAKEVLAAASAKAKSENKVVFLHFGAPWCGWCHHLENWMAQPAVASLLAKDFIDVKIDTDRMTGGKELLAAHCKEEGGIPWFEFIDESGKSLTDSGLGRKNLGFPSTDEEIASFCAMLTKAKRNLTDSDVASIAASLKAWREKTKQRAPIAATN